MGEATFSLRAEFESKEKLDEVFEDIKKFIKQGQKSEDFWQKNRHEKGLFWIKFGLFWIKFKAEYPDVFEYLGELVNEDNNNSLALAGELDFGMYNEIPEKDENILYFSAVVCHFASWNRFAEFLKKKFQAKKVKWSSDEYDEEYEL